MAHAKLRSAEPVEVGVPALPIARLMPGETLWSAAARTHYMLGGKSVKATLTMLFGEGAKYPPAQLLPSRLREFVKRSAAFGVRYSGLQVLREHTGFAYFTYFHTLEERMRVQWHAFRQRAPARMRALLGLQKARAVGPRVNPAFCPTCAENVYREHGYAHWHVEHQLPTVLFCRAHGIELLELKLAIGPLPSFELYMPPCPSHTIVPLHGPISMPKDVSADDVVAIGQASADLLRASPNNSGEWQENVKRRLRRMGYRTNGGIAYARLAADLRNRFGDSFLEWTGLKAQGRELQTEPLRRLVSIVRGRQPTVHFLVLALFLGLCASDLAAPAETLHAPR